MTYAKCPVCGEWSDDERHTNVAAKLAAAELMAAALVHVVKVADDICWGSGNPPCLPNAREALAAWEEAQQ